MVLKWDEKLSVGVEALDEQHKELFQSLEELVEAFQESRQDKQVSELIEFLDDYSLRHFRAEDDLMRLYGYPGSEHHRKEHQIFISRLENLKQDLATKGPSHALASQATHLLLKWIVSHIKNVDYELGRYLKTASATTKSIQTK